MFFFKISRTSLGVFAWYTLSLQLHTFKSLKNEQIPVSLDKSPEEDVGLVVVDEAGALELQGAGHIGPP